MRDITDSDHAALKPALLERRYVVPFLLIASLFFSWALAGTLNDVLVRQFRKALDLSRAEAGLVQFAFFIGYFCAALPAGWIMRRFGYKAGIVLGLGLYAFGALLFWPAAEMRTFAAFLGALYIIAFGLAFLETAANPYIAVLGDAQTGPARLNLAQSFWGLGAIVGPLLGGLFIFSGTEYSAAQLADLAPSQLDAYRLAEAKAVQLPYLGVALFVLLLAILIGRAKLPIVIGEGSQEGAGGRMRDALRHRHLLFSILTQFCYVGAQVAIGSYFIDFTKELLPGTPEKTVAFLLSGSLAALMVGRVSGAFLMTWLTPNRLLTGYALINVLLCTIAMTNDGWVAVGALWSTNFFMSIMYPTIFALGIRDLGPATKVASSMLVMAIIGGALLPVAMGHIADLVGGLRPALALPLGCFCVVAWFGMAGYRKIPELP